ncbi:GH36-type glycosyl hydrolase domain-containing protein [Methylovorus sp. SPW-M1]
MPASWQSLPTRPFRKPATLCHSITAPLPSHGDWPHFHQEQIIIKELGFSSRPRHPRHSEQDTELLRSELFSIEQLKRHAAMLATQHVLTPGPGPDHLLPRLADNARVLLAAYEVVTTAATEGQHLVPAESWLLDNFYLIEQQISLAKRHLPRGYSRQLPRLANGISAGFPRIYDLALALISHMDGRVDNDNASQVVEAYQSVEVLRLGELWAFPIMLQLALLENLRRVGVRIARRREERDAAIAWADRMLTTAEQEPQLLIQLLAEFANADVPLTAPFVEEFYSRLQAHGSAMAFVQAWVEHKLQEQGVTATQLSEAASRTAAANQISIANSISSLRFIGTMDWRNYVESLSKVEQVLRNDPAAMYAVQDFTTRDRYRHVIEDVARRCGKAESVVAEAAITQARLAAASQGAAHRSAHVGYFLVDHGLPVLEKAMGRPPSWKIPARQFYLRHRLLVYLAPMALLTALSAFIVLRQLQPLALGGMYYWLFAVLSMVGLSTLSVTLVNLVATWMLRPRVLPRLDFSQGIPPEHCTMVIVPTLLTSMAAIDAYMEALEIRYLGNRDAQLYFALLTDFPDALTDSLPTDAALLAHAHQAIATLNATYRDDRPCIFYLLHRPRTWNPVERLWMGYERKRGKLEQFNALLRGSGQAAFAEIFGDTTLFPRVRYVITLDTDTQLPRDTARTLVGNMAHPLNRPVYDARRGRIVEGYAILQPRAATSLTSATSSWFTRLFAGESGIDPYTREISDVYQDLFGEGSFIGKGIYDVDAFRQVVDQQFPDNLILSHDLLESGYARSALVSDVVLIEDYPASYLADVSRRHRWMRGDWQLVGWLFPRVPGPAGESGERGQRAANPINALSIWKIFDNLRRSMVAPALLMLLASGWLLGVGDAIFWTSLILIVLFAPMLLTSLVDLRHKPDDRDWLVHLTQTGKSIMPPLSTGLLTLVFLPYEALIALDAILRSGLRMLFTRRGLLLWHTRAYAVRNAKRTLRDFVQEMWIAPFLAIALFASLLGLMQQGQVIAWQVILPVLLAWFIAPVIAWRISLPLPKTTAELTSEQRLFLRKQARRTWQYFATLVGPDDHWLPPDNFQEFPAGMIASRTSPTNIGMALTSNLAAYDLGYLSAGELITRSEHTLSTMALLERYRGHFYNWYDTRTLEVLRPHYVSSVDSGNLAGCLLTLQMGLLELKKQTTLPSQTFHGLQDTFQVLEEHVPATAGADAQSHLSWLRKQLNALCAPGLALPSPTAAFTILEQLHDSAAALAISLANEGNTDAQLGTWLDALDKQCLAAYQELSLLSSSPHHVPDDGSAPHESQSRHARIDDLMAQCAQLAVMDADFLYDAESGLLSIGYDVRERRRDPSCYDLLASEARLASFLFIAEGKLPQKHWFTLGRLLTSQGGELSLISWSGSMFEYLMPRLMMPSYDNTLLDQTCKAVVLRQIEYGRQRGIPWGISESCYNATDASHVYQYRAFGVPGLGFKRGLADDLVIAPYATALALIVMPREACRNLQAMAGLGFSGQFGFYEAIDYTPSRVPRGKTHAVVKSYMVHHQGMSLLAFDHVLRDAPMQRRFMAAPAVQATALLLQERVPKKGDTLHPHAAEVSAAARPPVADRGSLMRVLTNPHTTLPEVHLLSNGHYHVMVTNSGGGYSRWRDLAITRWREDATMDGFGTFIYLRDRDTGYYWSSAYQPTHGKTDSFEAIFVQGRAEYRLRDQAIETHTEISVSPEDDVEIRRVTLANLSSRHRRIEITTYAEVVLAPLNADLAHRAFSNLFVQTEILADRQAILCTRRPRTPEEQVPWMFHLLAAPGAVAGTLSFETDRAQFIGRGRTASHPVVMDSRAGPALLSNSAGSVLDPIVAIRCNISLPADASAVIQIISGVADTREQALALLDKYCDRHFVDRAFEMAWFHSQEVLRLINASEADAQTYARLAASIIYASALRRAPSAVILRNQQGQSGLWRFGISGDLPIVLLRVGDISRLNLVKQALQAHAYWRMKGLVVDLVIINEDFSGYRALLHDQIMGLINTGSEAQVMDKPGGIFIRRAEELSEDARVLLLSVARVVLHDTADTLIEQIDRRVSSERVSDMLQPVLPHESTPNVPLLAPSRQFFNGLGGFSEDGREYIITLPPGATTPAPWSNVIASPHIGMVISESGSSYTWVENAHEFRLTTWHNDPMSDSSGEAFYVRDEESGAFWSPTPLPARGLSGYVCRHGFGYSVFEHEEAGIRSELTTFVAMDAPVKFVVIKLSNHSGRARKLSLTGYWELVLGQWRHANMMHVVTEIDPHNHALLARNQYGQECANRVVFAQVNLSERSMSGNRAEFIGRNGTLAKPAAMQRKRLSGRTGACLDPCAAIQAPLELAEGQTHEVVFVFGAGANTDEVHHYIQQYCGPAGADAALEKVKAYWEVTLGAVQVTTPDRAMDILTNGWLLYQTLACRIWARSGYYQSGGAYGFRDQLQDTMALVHTTPGLARQQLITCAERQFSEGDVQHWWHPPAGQGVRTHFSDDYLWLPYATCRYVQTTGDAAVLDSRISFLEGRLLNQEEESYYDQPQRSAEEATLYEHCVRAIRHGLRFGVHQLPLMGCGDWNDGMNLVGRAGQGESVWLAWFLFDNLTQFAALAQSRHDSAFAEFCTGQAALLRQHIEAHAWDGSWYRRAYFDDGPPLGSSSNSECQIDSISQSWAIISGGGNPMRARMAMKAVNERLVMRDEKLIRLLTPAFDTSSLQPGYIKGYVPGIRENGGQYTHAGVWASMAYAMQGDTEQAWALYGMLNPIHHGSHPQDMLRYKVEPYVMSADIYTAEAHMGRGGWSWYTGAAGWMYRLGLETLLGLELREDRLLIHPRIPADWTTYQIRYRYQQTHYQLNFRCTGSHHNVMKQIWLDGQLMEGWPPNTLMLVNDGVDHVMEIHLEG